MSKKEQILELWVQGLTYRLIALRVGTTEDYVGKTVGNARHRGDPRAISHTWKRKVRIHSGGHPRKERVPTQSDPPPQHGFKEERWHVSGQTVTLSGGHDGTSGGTMYHDQGFTGLSYGGACSALSRGEGTMEKINLYAGGLTWMPPLGPASQDDREFAQELRGTLPDDTLPSILSSSRSGEWKWTASDDWCGAHESGE